MLSLKVNTNKKEIIYNGVYFIQSDNPEITFDSGLFKFKMEIMESNNDSEKRKITTVGEIKNNIYTIAVRYPKGANEFGDLKDSNFFFKKENTRYSVAFIFNKMRDDGYILRINIFKSDSE